YHPEIILAGRRINDSMGQYVAGEVVKLMLKNDLKVNGANVLVLGITFKENCPDVRNTKVVDVIKHLQDYSIQVDLHDPWANPAEVEHEYSLISSKTLIEKKYDAVVLTVSHKQFLEIDLNKLLVENGVLYDVKGVLNGKVTGRL